MNGSAATDIMAPKLLRRALLIAVTTCSLSAGCSQRPAGPRPPNIDAQQSGEYALELHDSNDDRELDATELGQIPGILHALPIYDRDSNGKVSAAEIAARILQWRKDDTGLLMLSCVVLLDGRPLEGAHVRLVPEPFLGDEIRVATTTTGRRGQGLLKLADEDLPGHLRGLPGVALGIYKVEVTHPTIELPAKYHSATELGLEVGDDSPELQGGKFTLRLKSRS